MRKERERESERGGERKNISCPFAKYTDFKLSCDLNKRFFFGSFIEYIRFDAV